jgi:SAM-dependent MidA family methyltransferase
LCPDKLFSKETQSNLLIGDTIEVSVKSAILINSLSELIAINNGAILAMDYGENHAFRNSIRVIISLLFKGNQKA